MQSGKFAGDCAQIKNVTLRSEPLGGKNKSLWAMGVPNFLQSGFVDHLAVSRFWASFSYTSLAPVALTWMRLVLAATTPDVP